MRIEKELACIDVPSIYQREGKDCYFDTYRKKLIEVTPEETVRQKIASLFEFKYGVPKEMIGIEVPMSFYVKGEAGRADIIIHTYGSDGKSIYPIAVIECKNPDVFITDKVADQAIRYCDILGGKYIILTNGKELLMAVYDDRLDKYIYLNEVLSYRQMISNEYVLPKIKKDSFVRFTFKELENLGLINNYNNQGIWVFGESTSGALRSFAVNLYQCLLDTNHCLPKTSRKTFTLIEDIGQRYSDYSNAGGGHYTGVYRAFLVKDRFYDSQIVSLSIFGTEASFRNENRNSYTSIVVSIDNFKTSHNSLQYNVDRFANIRSDGEIEFFHNGQIGNYKCSDVIDIVDKNGDGLRVTSSGIYIGRLDRNKTFYLDDNDVSEFVYNLIEYALLREEVRKKRKK